MRTKKFLAFFTALIITSSASINVVFADDIKEYEIVPGLTVKEYIKTSSTVEVTDEYTKKLYSEIVERFGMYYCPDCGSSKVKIYAYDTVKYDNSTAEGKEKNYKLLNDVKAYDYLLDVRMMDIMVTGEGKNIVSYLDETYNLTENRQPIEYTCLRLYDDDGNVNPWGRIHISGFHYLNDNLITKIYLDLKEKGICKSAVYYKQDEALFSSILAHMEYPAAALSDVAGILSDSGIAYETVQCNDKENYFTVKFPDVENTTQMDVVKVKTDIYKITGLLGFGDPSDYVSDIKEQSYDADVYKSGNYMLGDINADRTADITDLSEISLAILGDKVFTEAQKEAADVDGDGEMTLADLAKFRQYITKQIESLG